MEKAKRFKGIFIVAIVLLLSGIIIVGVYWQTYEKAGYDPVQGEAVLARRRKITRQLELPVADAYSEFLQALLGHL